MHSELATALKQAHNMIDTLHRDIKIIGKVVIEQASLEANERDYNLHRHNVIHEKLQQVIEYTVGNGTNDQLSRIENMLEGALNRDNDNDRELRDTIQELKHTIDVNRNQIAKLQWENNNFRENERIREARGLVGGDADTAEFVKRMTAVIESARIDIEKLIAENTALKEVAKKSNAEIAGLKNSNDVMSKELRSFRNENENLNKLVVEMQRQLDSVRNIVRIGARSD